MAATILTEEEAARPGDAVVQREDAAPAASILTGEAIAQPGDAIARPEAEASSGSFLLRRGVARLVSIGGTLARLRGSRDPIWRQLLLIAWLCWLYDMLTELAPARRALALAHAHALLAFERSVGLDPELSLNRWLARQHTLALALSDYYDNAHFVVTLGLVGWLWWRRADIYVPMRNALVAINLLGFAVFLLYPVAPPRMLSGLGFEDVVVVTHAFGASLHAGSLAHDADQYAAMPSLHIAWAAWSAVALARLSSRPWRRRALGTLGGLHVALTAVIVLATGNHYLLDVLAGLLTAAAGFALAAALERLRE